MTSGADADIERPLSSHSRKLLAAMSDQEIIDTLDSMAASGSAIHGAKLGMLCQAMARMMRILLQQNK